jgi:uncharacterized cupredoxin-like copper-binding protein
MLRISLLAPFLVAALIAGCGSSSSSSTSSTASAAPTSSTAATSSSAAAGASGSGQDVSLSETEFKITPAGPAVAKTGTITITVRNSGTITHALAVQTPAGIVRTADIAPGATATLKVDATKAGKYTFYCPIGNHRMLGMQGVLTVGGSASSAGASAAGTVTHSSSSSNGY